MVWLKAAAAISTYAWARARPGRSRPCLRAMPLAPAQSPLHTASDAEIKNAPSRCFRLRANNCHAPSAVRDGSALLCPWFHLNSRLAGAHFIPGNGGGRRAISCPQLQGAFPRAPGGLAPDVLSLHPQAAATVPCQRCMEHFITENRRCQGKSACSARLFSGGLQVGLQNQVDIAGQGAVLCAAPCGMEDKIKPGRSQLGSPRLVWRRNFRPLGQRR